MKAVRVHIAQGKNKIENKSLTDNLDGTFNSERESNSKSYDHYHLVQRIEVVVLRKIVVVVGVVLELKMILVETVMVVQKQEC